MPSLRFAGWGVFPVAVAVSVAAGPLGAAPNPSALPVQAVPAEVRSIAAAVAPDGAGEEARARAIFLWVTSNIAYDPRTTRRAARKTRLWPRCSRRGSPCASALHRCTNLWRRRPAWNA